jgi:Protein of unknown function (DUF1580)
MIDFSEHLQTFAEAARTMPGGGTHVSTVHRWRLKGCRGVKLETIMRGGIRYTSTEALVRFFAAITAVANGEALPADHTTKLRQKRIEAAEKELAAAGI